MNRRIAARAIIYHEGKLLCARLRPTKSSPNKNTFWSIPGGGIDELESIEDCLSREIIEEIGVKPKIDQLLYVQQYKDSKREYLEFLFNVTNTSDFLNIDLSKTTHGAIEIEEVKFVDPKTAFILPKFLSTQDLEKDISSKASTKVFTYL